MRPDQERLLDVIEAAELIAAAVALGRIRFDEDIYVQSAVIRWIQVIGEAVAHISPELRAAHPDLPWRAASAMRNRTVHGYFDIDVDLVWAAAETDVPLLAAQLRLVVATG